MLNQKLLSVSSALFFYFVLASCLGYSVEEKQGKYFMNRDGNIIPVSDSSPVSESSSSSRKINSLHEKVISKE